jgi:hypothetical protein
VTLTTGLCEIFYYSRPRCRCKLYVGEMTGLERAVFLACVLEGENVTNWETLFPVLSISLNDTLCFFTTTLRYKLFA